jgi:hypothetical protein
MCRYSVGMHWSRGSQWTAAHRILIVWLQNRLLCSYGWQQQTQWSSPGMYQATRLQLFAGVKGLMAKSFSNIHRPDVSDLARPSMARSVAGE